MLTKDDLEQIDTLLKKRIGLTDDERINPLEKRMGSLEASLKRFEKKINKKLDLIISYFDRDVSRLGKRVDRLERHTGLPPFE